jgi:hypothetical protein
MRQDRLHTSEAFVSANGLTLCYETFGDPTNPPMVLIMGMGAQMVGWDDEFCEALAGRRFRVIRFDNRDAGKSDAVRPRGPSGRGIGHDASLDAAAGQRTVPARRHGRRRRGSAGCPADQKAHSSGVDGRWHRPDLAIHRPKRVLSLTSIMSTTGDPALPPPTPRALAAVFKPAPTELHKYVEQYVQTWRILRAGDPEEAPRDALAPCATMRGPQPAGAARQLWPSWLRAVAGALCTAWPLRPW